MGGMSDTSCGTLNITGGSITGNTATKWGNGIYKKKCVNYQKTGGTVSGVHTENA